jgi:hypothetical protein
MNWTKLSAIAETLGSVAIVVTLVYVAIQIQQNTDATLSSSRQASLDAELGLIFSMVNHPNSALASPVPFEDMTPQERLQMQLHANAAFRIRENLWLQFQAGTLDPATWETYRAFMILILSNPDTRQFWNATRAFYDPGFVAEIDALINSPPR